MSENKTISRPHDYNTAAQRHWLYGFNAVVLVVVATVAVIILLYLCERPRVRNATRWDWTTNRQNSLSQNSKKMLKEIEQSQQDFVLISMFTDPTDEDRKKNMDIEQAQHRQQINDLLRDYARNSARIKVEDKGDAALDEVQMMIRDRYASELEPYKSVIEEFNGLATELSKFMEAEAPAIGAAGQKAGGKEEDQQIGGVFQAAFNMLPSELEQIKRTIDRETSSVMPRWSRPKELISSFLEDSSPIFDNLADDAKVAQLGANLKEYFTANKARYKEMAAKVKAYSEKLAKLERLKAQEVIDSIKPNTVIVLGNTSAKVIPATEIYAAARDTTASDPEAPLKVFNGEQAISSALYGIAKPDKVKVVFVTSTRQNMLAQAFSETSKALEQANFEVSEWAPHEHQPGSPPDAQDEPPAKGKGVIWIVFPPEPMDMQAMMMGMQPPNPEAMIAAVRSHLDAGGSAMFLAEPSQEMAPGMGGFPFEEMLKDFGVDVEAKYTVIRATEVQHPLTGELFMQADRLFELDRLADHEITRPMRSFRTAFGGLRTQQGFVGSATVVKVLSPLPAGVEATVLASTPYDSDFWAESGRLSPSGVMRKDDLKYDADSDIRAPVPLAVAAIKDKGKETERRVVVIGSKFFAADPLVSGREVLRGRVIETQYDFPGNADLMRNSVLWLAGYENMIAVTAKGDAASRIGDVKPASLLFVRLAAVIFFPVAALVIGAAVWLIRRR